ncbi:MAG: sugar transferase [bacterium]|nr:sugar transferase [bacterium]
MKKRSELFFSLILVPIDFLMMIVGFVLAYWVRAHLYTIPIANPVGGYHYLKVILIVIPSWIVIFALTGLYNLQSTRTRLQDFGKIVVAVASGTMLLVLIDYFSDKTIFPSKSIAIYGLFFSIVLVTFGRLIVRFVQRFLFRYRIGMHSLLLIGDRVQIKELRSKINLKKIGYRLINTTSVYRGISWLKTINKHHHIDEIIQLDFKNEEQQLEIINYAVNHHISYKFVPGVTSLYKSMIIMSKLGNMPMVELTHTQLEGWGRIVKRIVDLVTSLLGLVILSPVFLIIAVIIKITDSGPAFYKHLRISRAGKKIKIYKFRTMQLKYCTGVGYSGKDDQQILSQLGSDKLVKEFEKEQKVKNDPRVTRFGRFLRKTSLDELPQLINALKGEISLVGPRAVTETELKRYGQKAGSFLAIKPGITGLWQVSGRSDINYDQRVKLDVYYVENWSLLLDIKILFKTFIMIIKGGDGY